MQLEIRNSKSSVGQMISVDEPSGFLETRIATNASKIFANFILDSSRIRARSAEASVADFNAVDNLDDNLDESRHNFFSGVASASTSQPFNSHRFRQLNELELFSSSVRFVFFPKFALNVAEDSGNSKG